MAFGELRQRAERDKWTKTWGERSTLKEMCRNKAEWTKVENESDMRADAQETQTG